MRHGLLQGSTGCDRYAEGGALVVEEVGKAILCWNRQRVDAGHVVSVGFGVTSRRRRWSHIGSTSIVLRSKHELAGLGGPADPVRPHRL
jgi:hypothetical protein